MKKFMESDEVRFFFWPGFYCGVAATLAVGWLVLWVAFGSPTIWGALP